MESRRDFLKKAAFLSGATVWTSVPESILRALAINPETGSTYLDAEHVVILMQENRSFDHSYGSLQGVRGYNDPRAHVLPNRNPVWFQTNADGETFAPFRLNIKETNVTWMGSLPHSWGNQVDARNDGRYDKWLLVKPSGYKGYAKKPMTLGHYTREDIPFYYSFADAFTICDQHFCSSLTGTTPNRLFLWSGTIREKQTAESKPMVYNEEADYGSEVGWTTFPERLESAGISWKVYQNEISVETGLKGEEDAWLGNFTDNPLEFFTQYNVRFSPRHRRFLRDQVSLLTSEIEALEQNLRRRTYSVEEHAKAVTKLARLKSELERVERESARWTLEAFEKLSLHEQRLHTKAFCVNENDPHYRELETLTYRDGETERKVQVPKGDVLHQFREDIQSGKLPTVSWIVGPENFSDHPSSAWYGAWYVSEALDILTKNPEVWKKTIFILTYDENDGYFDHVPPFVAPNPTKPETGSVSEGIDAAAEYITLEQDLAFRPKYKPRDSSIGLGYRVPMVVASPWSRGGCVCSEVFDHTSVIRFLEGFLSHKTGKPVEEPNISSWRRAVCGDLTSIFQPYHGEKIDTPVAVERNEFIEGIHKARFKSPPGEFRILSASEIEQFKKNPSGSPLVPRQEKGTRKSCPLPYELHADGLPGEAFGLKLQVGRRGFGKRSGGSPFNVYSYGANGKMQARAYALGSGKSLSDALPMEDGAYHIRVDGPNGFMREFKGTAGDPDVQLLVRYAEDAKGVLTGDLDILISNRSSKPLMVELVDQAYGASSMRHSAKPSENGAVRWRTKPGTGWYDFAIRIEGVASFEWRCAGRVETGKWGITDPAMGRR